MIEEFTMDDIMQRQQLVIPTDCALPKTIQFCNGSESKLIFHLDTTPLTITANVEVDKAAQVFIEAMNVYFAEQGLKLVKKGE
jgi:hypothetical protein